LTVDEGDIEIYMWVHPPHNFPSYHFSSKINTFCLACNCELCRDKQSPVVAISLVRIT